MAAIPVEIRVSRAGRCARRAAQRLRQLLKDAEGQCRLLAQSGRIAVIARMSALRGEADLA